MKGTWALWIEGAFILGVALLLYSNSFLVPFQFDDELAIVNNPAITQLRNLNAIISYLPPRALLFITFAMDYRLHGLEPMGYHWLNLFFHAMNGLILWLFLRGSLSSFPQFQGRDRVAFLSALFFVAHPLQGETVTYISAGRGTCMAVFFFLLSLYLYSRASPPFWGLQSQRKGLASVLYASSLLSFALALLTKEEAITLPVILLLYHYVFLRDSLRLKRLAVVLGPFFLVAGLFFLFRSLYFSEVGEATHYKLLVKPYLLTQAKVIPQYLKFFFIPSGISVDPDIKVVISWRDATLFPPALFLLTMLGMSILTFKKAPLAFFGLIWFFVTLLPTSSIVPLWDFIALRRTYLPSAGLSLLLSMAIIRAYGGLKSKLSERAARCLMGGFICLALFLLGLGAISRNLVWQSDETLWRDAAQKAPRKDRPHFNLGNALYKRGKIQEAEEEFRKGLSLNPWSVEGLSNLGALLMQQGRIEEAMKALQRADEILRVAKLPLAPKVTVANVHFNLALVYEFKGLLEPSIEHYQKAIEGAPFRPEFYNNLGNVYLKKGLYKEAIDAYKMALSLDPSSEPARRNLLRAIALSTAKEKEQKRGKPLSFKERKRFPP